MLRRLCYLDLAYVGVLVVWTALGVQLLPLGPSASLPMLPFLAAFFVGLYSFGLTYWVLRRRMRRQLESYIQKHERNVCLRCGFPLKRGPAEDVLDVESLCTECGYVFCTTEVTQFLGSKHRYRWWSVVKPKPMRRLDGSKG